MSEGPFSVAWAFVVGVDDSGRIYLIDHEFVTDVYAKRAASLDDIHAACYVAASVGTHFAFHRPSTDAYTVAFLVFQLPDGHIVASPDIFDEIIPVTSPGEAQVLGAFGVLQGQIIASKAANMAAQVAVQATLSVLNAGAKQANATAGKSEGGLYVA